MVQRIMSLYITLLISASYKPLSQGFLLGSLSIGIHTGRARWNAILGENGTQSIKSFRKWPLLWDCFVLSWWGLPELAASWSVWILGKIETENVACFFYCSHIICKSCPSPCGLSLLDNHYSSNFSVRKCSSL